MDHSGHRKIELQSPLDLAYLLSNIRRSARAKLDLNLPPLQGAEAQEDSLRKKVEELVEEFLQKTFSYATQNITINGLSPSSSSSSPSLLQPLQNTLHHQNPEETEEYTPYDSRLAARVQTLYTSLEQETLKLASLRRSAPSAAASAFSSSFSQRLSDDARLASEWAELAKNDGVDGDGISEGRRLKGVGLERQDEVRATYERAMDGLLHEKGAMTETAARLERAKAAVWEVEGGGAKG